MNYTNAFLFLIATCLLYSCSGKVIDNEAPDVYDLRWFDHPDIENDPGGDIVDGGNYTIGIESGFHIVLKVWDEVGFEYTEAYLLLNGDPEIRRDFIRNGDMSYGTKNVSASLSIRTGNELWITGDRRYTLEAGDTYEFYIKFVDIYGNTTEMFWTADIVE